MRHVHLRLPQRTRNTQSHDLNWFQIALSLMRTNGSLLRLFRWFLEDTSCIVVVRWVLFSSHVKRLGACCLESQSVLQDVLEVLFVAEMLWTASDFHSVLLAPGACFIALNFIRSGSVEWCGRPFHLTTVLRDSWRWLTIRKTHRHRDIQSASSSTSNLYQL